MVSATLQLIFLKEKTREIQTDNCKKTFHVKRVTVRLASACLHLPEKRHRLLGMKSELQVGFGSEEFNALNKSWFIKTNFNYFLSSHSGSPKQL